MIYRGVRFRLDRRRVRFDNLGDDRDRVVMNNARGEGITRMPQKLEIGLAADERGACPWARTPLKAYGPATS